MSADRPLHNGASALTHAIGFIGEEGNEITQEVFKIIRFGLMDKRPSGEGDNNLSLLQKELWDLVATVRVVNMELERRGLPPLTLDNENAIQKKITKLAYFGHRSLRNGTLAEPLLIMPTQSPE